MPRIFDNINEKLLDTLKHTLQEARKADFCVGYFNLRGWKLLNSSIDHFAGGENHCCRLLIGMQRLPKDELHQALALGKGITRIDAAEAIRLRKKIAQEFRQQLRH